MILGLLLLMGLVYYFMNKSNEVVQTDTKKKSSNPEKEPIQMAYFNHRQIRGIDTWGTGSLGASRFRNGKRYKHKGTDYVYGSNESVVSPINGVVKRHGIAYANTHLRLVVIRGTGIHEGLFAKVLYLSPAVQPNDSVIVGELIGYAQSLQFKYPGITDHIHFELWRHAERKSEGGILLNPQTLQEVNFNY